MYRSIYIYATNPCVYKQPMYAETHIPSKVALLPAPLGSPLVYNLRVIFRYKIMIQSKL